MIEPEYDLPTAIRIGAEIHPQGFGSYCRDGKTCVLGAAIEGAGFSVTDMDMDPFDIWPELEVLIDGDMGLFQAIRDLNDQALWTREEIADWLEVILP